MKTSVLAAVVSLAILLPAATADDPVIYKTKYRVIDIHRHSGIATEAAFRAMLEVDDRVGIAASVMLDGDSPHGSLPAWLELQKKFPDRLAVFWYLNAMDAKKPTFFTDIVREVDAAAKGGVRGVKVWKQLGMYARDSSGRLLKADDERLDPFWAKCVELKVAVTSHSPSTGWGSRVATNHYIHNHVGSFASAGEAFAKAVMLGGVTKRFPSLNFAFMEGGVAWASELYAGLMSHCGKRNPARIEAYDPRTIDGKLLAELFEKYAVGRMRVRPDLKIGRAHV